MGKIKDNLGKTTVKNHKMGPKSKLPSKYYENRLEEIKSKREYDELRMPLDDDDKLATEATIMGKKILPPDGYLVGKIRQTDNGMLVEYVKKKTKYPKSYKECCEYLMGKTDFAEYSLMPIKLSSSTKYDNSISPDAPHMNVINTFYKLFICRNAYWNIAGEEMGLDKSWQPKFGKYILYSIKFYLYQDSFVLHKGEYSSSDNCILVFPTEEMRDAFYENFKDLIESCKELL